MQPETGYSDVFLRSINVCYDAAYPDRIAHYHPTAKSALCLRALAGLESDRTFFVVAPYGSGKSIMATYLLHLMENQRSAAPTLRTLAQRLGHVSPELGRFATQRLDQSHRSALVVTLHGYAPSLAAQLKTAVLEAMIRARLGRQARPLQQLPCENIEQAIALLTEVQHKALSATHNTYDRLIILWDEFGRHLEALLMAGRPAALLDLQVLAEWTSRSTELPMTLGLLLHQELLRYASHMPQSVRAEWTKIEGRFRTIQYIDDSKEMYRLIGSVVTTRATVAAPPALPWDTLAQTCHAHGLFPDVPAAELAPLLQHAYPLEPVTLYLLPRLAARVAQHERTLFNFLYTTELAHPVGLDVLYDYFSPVMRADTAVGGTYRQWLETQSALVKVGADETAAKVLKSACLLSLGMSGERVRTSAHLLRSAVSGYHHDAAFDPVIAQLVARKLLLHRRHSDDIAVWHGADMDLRARLEEEKYQQRDHIKLLDFLAQEAPPPLWRPLEYNDDFCIRRYLEGAFHTRDTLSASLRFELPLSTMPVMCDGRVLYVLAETAEQLRDVEALAREPGVAPTSSTAARLILALPREPLPLCDAALEVACLLRMQFDADLIEADPLVVPELQQMTDDARSHMQRLLERLVRPSPTGPRWWYCGQEFSAETPRALRKKLSDIMRQVYPLTPKINNEMIVRHKPSSTIINARKKLLLGILERSGTANLGITGNFPDASMFRTVLLHTGLYRQTESGGWRYAQPHELQDAGLRALWTRLQQFWTLPSPTPKEFRPLFETLMAPPLGVRAGLLPIVLAASFKAFPSALSLTKGGAYVPDILPSDIEQLCREPDGYQVRVLQLDAKHQAYLRGLYTCFSADVTALEHDTDLIRLCFDALEQWKMQLPPAALLTQRLTGRTQRVQTLLRQHVDPVHLLFEKIPAACEGSIEHAEELLATLAACTAELMEVRSLYRVQAAAVLRRVLAFSQPAGDPCVRTPAAQWARCFSDGFLEALTDGMAKGVLTRMRTAYETDEALLDSLASLLVGKPLARWDDSTVALFERELHNVVRRVEEAALVQDAPVAAQDTASHGLAVLVQGRLTELVTRLITLVGPHEADAILATVQATARASCAGKDCDGNA